jgi:protein SCO1/2
MPTPTQARTASDITLAQAPNADVSESIPDGLAGVGIDEHLGKLLPLDLQFVDESGRKVTLARYFGNSVPVILTLNYSNCPMLCSLELTGLANGLSKVDLKLGGTYQILTISLDPHESPEVALKTRERYLKHLGTAGSDAAWHFLTGTEQAIRALADAVGFRYRYDSSQNQYYHPAAIAIASAQGRLMRYLYGIEYNPRTLKLGLLEAAQGKVGSTTDRLLLFCSTYSPADHGYKLVASRIVTIAGLLVMAALAGVLAIYWRREAKRSRRLDHVADTVPPHTLPGHQSQLRNIANRSS